jgi:hypothetical protein
MRSFGRCTVSEYYRYYSSLSAFLLATTRATNGDRFWAKLVLAPQKQIQEEEFICRSLTQTCESLGSVTGGPSMEGYTPPDSGG